MHTSPDRGSTIVEVLVALLLLTIAAVGAAELATLGARSAFAARAATSSLALTVQKSEQLRALMFAVDVAGTFVTDEHTDLSANPATTGGTGTHTSPAGVLENDTNRFADFLDRRSRWVAAGSTPPPAAVFVRRWSFERRDAAGSPLLIERVLVTPVAHADRIAATTTAVLGLDAATIAVRSRTTR